MNANSINRNDSLIERSYREHYDKVLHFIASRINNFNDAENLTQDVWMRLLTQDKEIQEETLLSYIFTIARNLITDYLRHYYMEREYSDRMEQEMTGVTDSTPEALINARDIARHERHKVAALPRQRRIIYIMNRYQERHAEEIASALSLSIRTVENHLRMGRRDVREYIAAIA